jgi:hypothetical protein
VLDLWLCRVCPGTAVSLSQSTPETPSLPTSLSEPAGSTLFLPAANPSHSAHFIGTHPLNDHTMASVNLNLKTLKSGQTTWGPGPHRGENAVRKGAMTEVTELLRPDYRDKHHPEDLAAYPSQPPVLPVWAPGPQAAEPTFSSLHCAEHIMVAGPSSWIANNQHGVTQRRSTVT